MTRVRFSIYVFVYLKKKSYSFNFNYTESSKNLKMCFRRCGCWRSVVIRGGGNWRKWGKPPTLDGRPLPSHMPIPGLDPGSQWWQASALTTALYRPYLYICRVMMQYPPDDFAVNFSDELSNLLKLFGEVAQTFDKLSADSDTFPGLQQVYQHAL